METLDLSKVGYIKKDILKEIPEARTQTGRTREEEKSFMLEKDLKKLKNIYTEEIFSSALTIDYPYRPKSGQHIRSIRYTPRVVLGFGKYKDKTLFEVFTDDLNYFDWMFRDGVLKFGSGKTSPKVNYSNKV